MSLEVCGIAANFMQQKAAFSLGELPCGNSPCIPEARFGLGRIFAKQKFSMRSLALLRK
jgi:hypothetical protein